MTASMQNRLKPSRTNQAAKGSDRRARSTLEDIERGCDQRVAAETKNHARCMYWPDSSKAGPAGVESQVWIDQQPSYPIPNEEPERDPAHRENNSGLCWIIVIVVEPFLARLRVVIPRNHDEDCSNGEHEDHCALTTERIIAPSDRHEKTEHRNDDEYDEGELAFVS